MGAQLTPSDLFALSDALQMNLHIRDRDKATDTITGGNKTAMKMPEIGLAMTIKPKIISSRVWMGKSELEECFLLIKVQGELFMLATYKQDGTLTMSLINGFMIADILEGFFGNNSRAKPGTLRGRLAKAVVATYTRHCEEKDWKVAEFVKEK